MQALEVLKKCFKNPFMSSELKVEAPFILIKNSKDEEKLGTNLVVDCMLFKLMLMHLPHCSFQSSRDNKGKESINLFLLQRSPDLKLIKDETDKKITVRKIYPGIYYEFKTFEKSELSDEFKAENPTLDYVKVEDYKKVVCLANYSLMGFSDKFHFETFSDEEISAFKEFLIPHETLFNTTVANASVYPILEKNGEELNVFFRKQEFIREYSI